MASLKLLPTTLAGPLWGKTPHPKANGILLESEIASSGFTTAQFAPNDPTRFCVADDSGATFLFNLKKNKFLVVARLTTGAVSSISFIGEKSILVAAGMTLHMVNIDTARVENKAKGSHNNNILKVVAPEGGSFTNSAVSISNDMICLWHTVSPQLELRASKPAVTPFVDVKMTADAIYTIETSGFATKFDMALNVVTRIDVSPFKPTSLSIYDTYIVVGSKTPHVMCLSPELEGISALAIPGSAGVVATSIIGGELFAAQCSDGTTWFVAAKNYGVSFSMSHPCPHPSVCFATGGATYAVIMTKQRMFLYHVPTAKVNFDRLLGGGEASSTVSKLAQAHNSSSSLSYASSFVQGPQDHTLPVPSDVAESSSVVINKTVLSAPDPDNKERPWVKVNLINNAELKGGPGISKPIPLRDAVNGLHNAVNGKKDGGSTTSKAAKPKPKAKKSADKVAAPDASLDEFTTDITMRALLDHDSRIINMDKIRSMLMRYGIFPDRYRHLVWRFLVHLPDKRLSAPHFAVLASKGAHPSTHVLTKPFPLPENRLRLVFQRTLSALAWHSPVFSVAHFMPNIVFPFVKVFGADIQSSIEVIIAFFLNWGQEFFTYYPHPPVAITSFLNHTLKVEDPELWKHFDDHGLSTDTWVWQPLSSVYTDVLTRNEWLQVMDHAFSNEPLWLFLFHVRWVCHIRAPLLQLADQQTLVAMFKKCTPCNVNHVIRETYRLHNRCIRTELTAPYETMKTFDETQYPAFFESNDAAVTTKVQELEKLVKHENEVVQSQNRISQVKKQLVEAAMLEDAFVGKQRALVAAKFDVENETWVQQVQLEKERQRLRDVEHETRLGAIQEQLRSAQRLEALQQEMAAAQANSRDANMDREKEVTKWEFADRMAGHEIERLEQGARMKLAMMMTSTNTQNPVPEPHPQEAVDASSGLNHSHVDPAQLGGGGSQVESTNMSVVAGAGDSSAQVAGVAEPPPKPSPPQHTEFVEETFNNDHDDHQEEEEFEEEVIAPPPEQQHTRPPNREVSPVATQTELPPPAPRSMSSPSSRTSATNRHSGPGFGSTNFTSSVTTTDSTSVPSSSCDEDPIAYYRRLQKQIEEGVAKAQKDQRAALAQLKSRYARTLTQDVTSGTTTTSVPSSSSATSHNQYDGQNSSTVTEPLCDDDTETETSTTYTAGQSTTERMYQQFLEDTTATTSSMDESSGFDSSSMTRVLLRPQDDAIFDLSPASTLHTTRGGRRQ